MTTTTRRLQAPTPRVALLLITTLIVGVILYLGRDAVTPFLLGLLLIYVMDPMVGWLHRRGVPRGLSVLLVYVLVFGASFLALALLLRPLVSQVIGFIGDLPRFNQAVDEATRQLRGLYEGLQLPPALREAIDRALADLGNAAGAFDVRSLLPIASGILGAIGALFGYIIVPVWAFYLLKDRERLLASFDRSLPDGWRRDTWAVLRIVERIFGRWLRAQILLGLLVGAATFAGLIVLGLLVDERFIRFAILLAVVAGLFELLPIIGPILSMIPTLLVALTVSPQAVVAVFLLYLLVQQLENNVLVPKIQGEAIELHASVVIFSLIIGGSIAGLLGAILALPITAAGKEIYRYLFRRLSEDADAVQPERVRPMAPEGPEGATPDVSIARADPDGAAEQSTIEERPAPSDEEAMDAPALRARPIAGGPASKGAAGPDDPPGDLAAGDQAEAR
ncbi:MAG: AI-2E family transporter [Chloroflexi bacterium]|nr:AI-2E family transporter [Chloroflexota bacterium]